MRLLLLALAFPLTIASPIPNASDFDDIERRWSEGHSEVVSVSRVMWPSSQLPFPPITRASPPALEQQIHNGLTHRDMTPAWPMHTRDSTDSTFATATDERSIEASVLRTRASSLMEQMKDFAERFMRSKGLDAVIARRGEELESVPVLRPRKGVRWSFGEE